MSTELTTQETKKVDLAFSEKVKERELLSEVYGEIIKKDITSEVAIEARTTRLRAVAMKSSISAIHKTQKEFALAHGKYCDAWKRKETEPIQQMIDALMDIEKFEERQEVKRIEELQSKRVDEISPYVEDAADRELAGMDEDVWVVYLGTKKKDYLDKVKAEEEVEKQRIEKEKAEAIEHERIRKENEVLKKEAEEQEKLRLKEQEKLAKEKSERERIETERNKARDEIEAKKREDERKFREAAMKKIKDAEDETKRLKDEAENKLQTDLNKGDSEKVQDLINDFKLLKTKYQFESAKNKKMYESVGQLIDKTINYI